MKYINIILCTCITLYAFLYIWQTLKLYMIYKYKYLIKKYINLSNVIEYSLCIKMTYTVK